MSWILDAIIVAIIVLSVIITAKKGFVKTVFRIVGLVCAIVLSFTLSGKVSSFIYEKTVEPALCKTIEATINKNSGSQIAELSEKIVENLPFFIKNNIDSIDSSALSEDSGESSAAQIAKSFCDKVIKAPAMSFTKIIVTVVLLALLTVAFMFLANLLNKLFSFSIVGKLNRTLGGVLGLISGCTAALVFILAAVLLSSLTGGFLCFKKEYIEASYIFNTVLKYLPFSI